MIRDLLQPAVTCHDRTILKDIQKELTRRGPVAVYCRDRWRLLLPQMAIGYPNTRLAVDLPLVDPPLLSPNLSLPEAAEILANSSCPLGLVLEGEKLLGQVSLRQVLKAIAEEARHAAQLGEALSHILLRARALVWRYPLPMELISSRGEARPSTLQGLEIHGPMEDLLGYSLEDFKTRPNLWYRNVHPENRPKVIHAFQALLRGKETLILEYRFRRRDGSWVCLRDQVKVEHNPEGELVAFTGVLIDVTEEMEQRRLEDLVHRIHRILSRRNPGEALEKAYELMGEQLPIDTILVWIITKDGIHLVPQWIRRGFQDKVQALTQEAHRIFPPSSKPIRLQSNFKKVIEEGRPVYIPDLHQVPSPAAELVVKHGFRSAFIFPLQLEEEEKNILGLVSSRTNALNDRQRGVLEDLFLTFSSVIRVQHYERKLMELNTTLEERVRQRTFELQTLYEVTKKFGYTLSYDELFRLVVTGLQEVMNFDVAATLLATDQVVDLVVYPSRTLSQEVLDEIKQILLEHFRGEIADKKITLRFRELEKRRPVPMERLGSSFQVSLPVGPGGRTRGMLMIGSEQENAFSKRHVNLLETVVNQASVAVQRLREFLATQEQRLQTLVETLPEGIVLLNQDKHVALCNPTGGQYLALLGSIGLGDRLEQLGDIPVDELLKPSSQELWREVEGPDGRIFEIRSYPVEMAPKPVNWTLIIRDVTKVRESDRKVRSALEGTVYALALAIDRRDPYTAGHQKRVAELAKAIALEMGLQEELIHGIYIGALVHDLGKISIPSEILVKPGHLSDFEFALIKQHPLEGYGILEDVDLPWPVAKVVLQHHERIDGSGYPHGLRGGEIALEAKIVAVADVVEAMSSHRPYRPALGIEKALDEINQNRGKTYDPQVADACLRLFREKGFEFKNGVGGDSRN